MINNHDQLTQKSIASAVALVVVAVSFCSTAVLAETSALTFGFPKTYFIVDCEKRLTAVASVDKLTIVDDKLFVPEEALPWFSFLMQNAASMWKAQSNDDGTAVLSIKYNSDRETPTVTIKSVGQTTTEFDESVRKTVELFNSNLAFRRMQGMTSAEFQLILTSDLKKLPRDSTTKLPKEYNRGSDGRFVTDTMKFAPGQPFRTAVLPEIPRHLAPEAAEFEKASVFVPFLSMSCRLLNSANVKERSFHPSAANIINSVRHQWAPPKQDGKDQVRLIAAIESNGNLRDSFVSSSKPLRPSEFAALHAIRAAAPFKPFKIAGLETAWVCIDLSYSPRPDDEEVDDGSSPY